jgi:hypothetical protein
MHDKGNNRSLYTVILEFSGTTSAAQVRAQTPEAAINEWSKALKTDEAYGLTPSQASDLLTAFDTEEGITAIRGLGNVWCKTLLPHEELALLHIIKTVEVEPPVRHT